MSTKVKNTNTRDFNVAGVNGVLCIGKGVDFGPIIMGPSGIYGVLFVQQDFNKQEYFWKCSDENSAFEKFREIKRNLCIEVRILIKETATHNYYMITEMSDTVPLL